MKILLFGFLIGVTPLLAASDPIATLVDELSANPMWENGSFPVIRLSREATTEEVVKAYFAKTTDRRGKIKDFEIHEKRVVKIRGSLHSGLVWNRIWWPHYLDEIPFFRVRLVDEVM